MDPLIHLWGIKAMTGERGDECVWGRKGTLAPRTMRSTRFLEMLFLTRENPAYSAQATQPPLPAQEIQSPPSPPTPCAHGHPQRTWNWRHFEQEWTSTPSSPLPALCLLTMWSRYSGWTVNGVLAPLLRERLELLDLLFVCVCVWGYNLGYFRGHVSVSRPVNWGRLVQLRIKSMSPNGKHLGQRLGLRLG